MGQRVIGTVLVVLALSGCVRGYTYAPREGFEWDALAFRQALAACDNPSGVYPVPLIALPVMYGVLVALRERTRRCMEARGWRVVEPPPLPVEHRPDQGLDP